MAATAANSSSRLCETSSPQVALTCCEDGSFIHIAIQLWLHPPRQLGNFRKASAESQLYRQKCRVAALRRHKKHGLSWPSRALHRRALQSARCEIRTSNLHPSGLQPKRSTLTARSNVPQSAHKPCSQADASQSRRRMSARLQRERFLPARERSQRTWGAAHMAAETCRRASGGSSAGSTPRKTAGMSAGSSGT